MKAFITQLSIKQKIVSVILFISVAVVSVTATVFYVKEVQLLRNAMVINTQTQATLIASSVVAAITFDDKLAATDSVRLLKNNEQALYAAVVLLDNSVFAEYANENITQKPIIDLTKQTRFDSDHLEVVVPILDNDATIGHLYLCVALDQLNALLEKYRKIFIVTLLLSAFVSYLLALKFQRLLTKPIMAMVKQVENLAAQRDYTKRLSLNLTNELGSLQHGFNHVLDAVEERETQLKRHSETLQDIVNKRTKQLYQKAHFDALTGLPNRYLLLDRLDHAISNAKRNNGQLAVLFMDLDRFKVINDSLGHEVGDQLLQAVSVRLKNVVRECDTVARLGGDEFVILLENVDHARDCARVAEAINQVFEAQFNLEHHVLHVSTSIGICVYPDDGADAKALLKHADISMYHSKQKGPSNYSFYEAKMDEKIHLRLEVENQLRHAIEYDELYLHYQPQTCIKTGDINKVEALIRWHNKLLGQVPPIDFISVAEEIGIINQIGLWVVEQACQQVKSWQDAGLKSPKVAVNISSTQLLDGELINHFERLIEQYEIEAHYLEIEITEDVFVDQSTRTVEVISALRDMGINIAIDDFGTGYSSLSYLKKLPIDTLKLDGAFVSDVQYSASSQGIVSSTIMLAHSLGMKIVAEGVETQSQLNFLKSQNCDYAQGYYLYRPMPSDEVTKHHEVSPNYKDSHAITKDASLVTNQDLVIEK